MLQDIIAIVQEGGKLISDAFDKPRNITHKGTINLVTETDIAVENFLKKALHDVVPGAIFMAEESAKCTAEPTQTCWIIDPLDGTTNFVHHLPFVATSVALWQDGQIVLGVVNAPILHQCFSVERGKGSFGNGKRLCVSDTKTLQDSLIHTGFPYDTIDHIPWLVSGIESILPSVRSIRRMGAAAIDLCYVAAGYVDAYYEMGLKPWDVAAGILMVEEAGGCISTGNGLPYSFNEEILASNGHIHKDLHHLLQKRMV